MDYNDPIWHFSYKPTFFAFSGEIQAVMQKNIKLPMKDKEPAV